MNKTNKISIIIPVFNVEKYIQRCIDSLLSQTLKDIEFVFIGDACTDRSMEIVESNKEKDNRIITLYNEANIGPGQSRNKGIAIASGEYLGFVDGDDWIDIDFYEKLYQKAKETNADICKGNVQIAEYNDSHIQTKLYKLNNDNIRKRMADGAPLYGAFVSKHFSAIYKKSLFNDTDIRYGEGYNGEDSTFLLKVCLHAKSIEFVDDTYYYYFLRENSLSSNSKRCNFQSLRSLDERVDILLEKGFSDYDYDYLSAKINHFTKLCLEYLNELKQLDINEVQQYVNEVDAIIQKVSNPSRIYSKLKHYYKIKQIEASLLPSVGVSVIIPVYNTAPFLHELFEALENQTFKDFEVIFVDDGSTDETLDLVMEECKKDARFKFIAQSNLGAGVARNNGFKLARGKYVMWWDADDLYSTDLLKEMYTASEKHQTDMTICLYEFVDFSINESVNILGFNPEVYKEDVVINPSTIPLARVYTGVRVPNKMYLSQFVRDSGIEYSATKSSNDVFFNFATIYSAKRVIGIPKVLETLRRFINPNSITSNRALYLDDVVDVLDDLYVWLKQKHLEKTLLEDYISIYVNSYLYNAGYSFNYKFVNKMTDTICTKEPWINMTQEEFYHSFWAKCNADWMENDIITLMQKVQKDENDMNAFALIDRYHNRIRTTLDIERLAQFKYQKIININSKESLESQIKELKKNLAKVDSELQRAYKKNDEIRERLQQVFDDRSEINRILQRTYDEKSEINARLQLTYEEKSDLNAKLQQTYKEKSEINAKLKQAYKEKTERGDEIKKIKEELEKIKNSKSYKLATKISNLKEPFKK